jgi:hypothetical protein
MGGPPDNETTPAFDGPIDVTRNAAYTELATVIDEEWTEIENLGCSVWHGRPR